MPNRDFTSRTFRRAGGLRYVPGKGWLAWMAARKGDRKPGREDDPGAVPVAPDRPLNLSGGAAEALDFED